MYVYVCIHILQCALVDVKSVWIWRPEVSFFFFSLFLEQSVYHLFLVWVSLWHLRITHKANLGWPVKLGAVHFHSAGLTSLCVFGITGEPPAPTPSAFMWVSGNLNLGPQDYVKKL